MICIIQNKLLQIINLEYYYENVNRLQFNQWLNPINSLCPWLRHPDTKKIGAEVFGKL
jgi:hypothetical protein